MITPNPADMAGPRFLSPTPDKDARTVWLVNVDLAHPKETD
jgi:hypothetical protein